MKKILLRFITLTMCFVMCVPSVFAVRQEDPVIRVGLAYGSGALKAANLWNNDGYGTGYRFGYFDEDLSFEEVAYTDEDIQKITMLRASQLYLRDGAYLDEEPDGDCESIGCYHVVMETAETFEEALELAEWYDDAFVAWIQGEYQVRVGAFETKQEAEDAAWELDGLEVKGTSAYAVNVVETGDSQILFQFDGGSDLALGVMPDVTREDDVRTWFKGYRYRGGFRYERIGGGDLTVVNIVDMETYIKGVIPYEMNNQWPMEALKAQAVCARSYGYNAIREHSHSGHHFDICTTECCQVYHGVGADNAGYQANERTDQAVDETAGMYGLYEGTPIIAYYSSSHGGASERIDNVWYSSFEKYPYICGVKDPYEQLVADINPKSYWKLTYTAEELTRRLQDNGYGIGTEVSSLELTYSEVGNVIKVKVHYANGKNNTFTPKGNSFGVRSLFGVASLHFTINGQDASDGETVRPDQGEEPAPNQILVNGKEVLDTQQKLYVLTGSGRVARVDLEEIYVISGTGEVAQLCSEEGEKPAGGSVSTPVQTVVTIEDDIFVVEGGGYGHQLGMSQYGAYAMAQEGFDYDEIVEFYYPGVEVDYYEYDAELG